MKNSTRRIISIILIGLISLMQCGIALATDETTNDNGAYLEIVDFQSEYTAGEEFNAVLNYHDGSGNVRNVHIVIEGITVGILMLNKILAEPAPSILAASIISSEIFCKPAMYMIII